MTRESENYQTAGAFLLVGGGLACIVGTVFTTLVGNAQSRRPAPRVTTAANGLTVRF